MPIHLDALTDKNNTEIFAWILQNALQDVNDAFAAKKDGKKYALGSYPLSDQASGMEIGKIVFTFFINEAEKQSEVLDVDIVLNNQAPVKLLFDRMLSASSDSNEYYEAVTEENEQHLNVETVNRYAEPGEIEGTKQEVYASAFPFKLTIFDSLDALNEFFGFNKEIKVGGTDFTVQGLGANFICPGNILEDEEDEAPWSMIVGEIIAYREIRLAFGTETRDAYIIVLRTALGNLPTLVGKEIYETGSIGIHKIVGMHCYVKVNFVKDKYPKPGN